MTLDLDERILQSLLDYAADVGEIIRADADGVFRLTPFGQKVTGRYGKVNGDRTTYNMFDVRVGAWGPVWANLGEMLRKTKVYGVDLHRAADRLAATAVVEVGPTSGILAQLAAAPGGDTRRYVGVDISQESLEFARRLARERGVDSISWYHGDVFEPAVWMEALAREQRVMYFSCHFHEFLSHGVGVTERALQELTAAPNTAGILALEQPRLEPELREGTSSTRWLYAQSNVLIHHLIKNARVMYGSEWQELLRKGGCGEVWVEGTKGFGFNAYIGATSSSAGPHV